MNKPKSPLPKITAEVAVCYLRQSKTDAVELAAGASLSSDAQIARCAAYCTLHGFTLDEATGRGCMDLDTSAKAQVRGRRVKDRWKRRPGLLRLYELAETRAFQHLICYDLSRLARDVSELFEIRDAFGERGVTIHLVSESIRTDTDLGELILGILGSVYQMESRNQSRRFRDTWQAMAERGQPHGKAPAWVVTDTEKPTTDPARYSFHPERADAMRRLVEMRLTGDPYHVIARTLNSEGHRRMDGGQWRTENVFDMLQPDRRAGLIGNQVFKGSSGKAIVLKGVFPALLSGAEYQQLATVQKAIASTTVQGGGKATTLKQSTISLASGLIYCGICGQRMKAISSATIYRQYMCVNAYASGIPHPAQRPTPREIPASFSIGRDKIDNSLMDALRQIADRYPASAMTLPPKPRRAKPGRTAEEINAEADYLYEERRDGRLAQADYDRRYAKLLKERADLEEQEESASGAESMRHALHSLSSTPGVTTAQARLLLRLLAARIEYPVAIEGEAPTRSGMARQGLRITFKGPLPDGVTGLVVGVYRAMYKGERYANWEKGK